MPGAPDRRGAQSGGDSGGARLLKNGDVPAATAIKETQQVHAVEVRVEDVLRDLKAIAQPDLQTLSEQSGIQARWADKLKAPVLLVKHRGSRFPSSTCTCISRRKN